MINLPYLDSLNDVEIYNALKRNSKHFQVIYLAIFYNRQYLNERSFLSTRQKIANLFLITINPLITWSEKFKLR